jgi:hypothetical protein
MTLARLKHFGWGREGEGLTPSEEACVLRRSAPIVPDSRARGCGSAVALPRECRSRWNGRGISSLRGDTQATNVTNPVQFAHKYLAS